MIRLRDILKESTEPLGSEYNKKYIPIGVGLANDLISVGFNKEEAAAIVGNMWAESTFKETAGKESGPYGLIQWRGERLTALKKYAELIDKDISDKQVQIWFLKIELKNGYKSSKSPDKGLIPGLPKGILASPNYEVTMFKRAMAGSTVKEKALGFATKSERMGSSELKASKKSRRESAQTVYDNL